MILQAMTISLIFCLLTNGYGQTLKTLKYIETDKPELLNPLDGSKNIIGVRILELIFRGLITQNKEGDWVHELAAQVPNFKPADKELVVHLQEGVQWPDGIRLTAHDVVFSYQVYMDEDNRYGNRNILEVFDSVKAIDDRTIRFVLKQSDRRAISRMGFHLMPKHLLRDTFLDLGNILRSDHRIHIDYVRED